MVQTPVNQRETRLAQRRYDRIAPFYDAFEAMMELRAGRWRRELWSRVRPGRVLELGVGTGKNLPFYPEGREIVAIDISRRMLERARRRAQRLGVPVNLELGDVQAIAYPDASFDVVVATFLYCSVPDSLLGLKEARRVLVPGGQLLLLEHVLSRRPIMRHLMQWLDPVPFHLWGAHINRETVDLVQQAGFENVVDVNLSFDVVRRIEASAPGGQR